MQHRIPTFLVLLLAMVASAAAQTFPTKVGTKWVYQSGIGVKTDVRIEQSRRLAVKCWTDRRELITCMSDGSGLMETTTAWYYGVVTGSTFDPEISIPRPLPKKGSKWDLCGRTIVYLGKKNVTTSTGNVYKCAAFSYELKSPKGLVTYRYAFADGIGLVYHDVREPGRGFESDELTVLRQIVTYSIP